MVRQAFCYVLCLGVNDSISCAGKGLTRIFAKARDTVREARLRNDDRVTTVNDGNAVTTSVD